jgi:hypothetical protein
VISLNQNTDTWWGWEWEMGRKKRGCMGEYSQSTLYICTKGHNETHTRMCKKVKKKGRAWGLEGLREGEDKKD